MNVVAVRRSLGIAETRSCHFNTRKVTQMRLNLLCSLTASPCCVKASVDVDGSECWVKGEEVVDFESLVEAQKEERVEPPED